MWCLLLIISLLSNYSDGKNEFSNVMKVKSHRIEISGDANEDTIQENFENYDFLSPFDIYNNNEIPTLNSSVRCRNDIMAVAQAVNKREKWALQMLDASARFPLGLLHGNVYQLGNFDECVNVKNAQYCLADVSFGEEEIDRKISKNRHKFNNTIHWALCVPASCGPEDVAVVSETFLRRHARFGAAKVAVSGDKCHFDKPQPFTIAEIVFGLVIGAFLLFTALATCLHFLIIWKPNKPVLDGRKAEIVLCFSAINNARKFLSTRRGGLSIGCIDGIRFVSMLFIVFSHTFLFTLGGPVQNTGFYEKESRSFLNTIFVNSPLLVDTFLLVSGFLVCYLILTELDKNDGKIDLFRLYVARYIRFTPAYIAIIGLYSTVMFRLGNGPLWDSRIREEQERCIKSWWTNILYINNYVKTDDICMFQVWQLSVDYQLYLIAPFVVYPLWRFEKIGKIVAGLVVALTVVTPCIITYLDDLDPTLMVYAPELYDLSVNYYYKVAYIKTHMRAGPYFVGILIGYTLHEIKTRSAKIPKYVLVAGWVLAPIFGTLAMISVVVFYQPDYVYNGLDAAIYYFFHKVAWCACMGWMIVTCATGNALYANAILCWKVFVPLSKLAYSAFLIDGFLELYALGSLRKENYMSKFELANRSFAHIVIVFGSAVFVTVLFESPIREAEKIFFRKIKSDKPKREVNVNIQGA